MPRLFKLLTVAALGVSFCNLSYGTDTTGQCTQNCNFTITIGNVRNYRISVSWHGAAGTSGTPVVDGMNKTVSYSMAAGNYTIHAQYLEPDGVTVKNPAAAYCPNRQTKYSYTNHNQRCAEYTEASVTVTY